MLNTSDRRFYSPLCEKAPVARLAPTFRRPKLGLRTQYGQRTRCSPIPKKHLRALVPRAGRSTVKLTIVRRRALALLTVAAVTLIGYSTLSDGGHAHRRRLVGTIAMHAFQALVTAAHHHVAATGAHTATPWWQEPLKQVLEWLHKGHGLHEKVDAFDEYVEEHKHNNLQKPIFDYRLSSSLPEDMQGRLVSCSHTTKLNVV